MAGLEIHLPDDDLLNTATPASAWLQARLCSEQAARTDDPAQRAMLLKLRNSWIHVANELQIIEGVRRARRMRMRRVKARR